MENLSSALVQVAGDQLQLNVMKLKVSAEMYAKDIGGALEQGAGLLGVVREEHQENTPDKQAAAEQAVLEGAFATDRGRREITQVAADIPALKPGINPA